MIIESGVLEVTNGAKVDASIFGKGNGGNVTITTDSLEVTNSSQIGAGIFGFGDAGNVNITAKDTIILAPTVFPVGYLALWNRERSGMPETLTLKQVL